VPRFKKQVYVVRTDELWHRCLGRPSREVRSLLARDLDFKSVK